jgi:ElaB/YqjD/DUF883 family membrane-anchored ribosome-binding protein
MQIPSNSIDTNTKSAESHFGINSKHQSGVSREFHNFIAYMEDLVKATSNLTGDDLSKAKAKLTERVAAAKESITEMGESIAHRVGKGATITNEYVHEKPWNVIGTTAVVGFLLGYLLARRA